MLRRFYPGEFKCFPETRAAAQRGRPPGSQDSQDPPEFWGGKGISNGNDKKKGGMERKHSAPIYNHKVALIALLVCLQFKDC